MTHRGGSTAADQEESSASCLTNHGYVEGDHDRHQYDSDCR